MGGETTDPTPPQQLIAERLREVAGAGAVTRPDAVSEALISEWEDGDIAVIERGGDLTHLPISSERPGAGPAVVLIKRWLQRLLHPLPQTQGAVNAASARTLRFLLRQLAAQARAIERLETELAELRAEQREP